MLWMMMMMAAARRRGGAAAKTRRARTRIFGRFKIRAVLGFSRLDVHLSFHQHTNHWTTGN